MTRNRAETGVLTLDILNESIDKIRAIECDSEVVGFKLNPADLREIRGRTMSYCGFVNNSLLRIPLYQGLRLESDVNQPRGYVNPIRRNNA